MRNDSVLYTGGSSASRARRVEKTEVKTEQRRQLKPAAEIVMSLVASEMDSVMRVTDLDIVPNERLFMIEMKARQQYVRYLKGLQNKLSIILREPEVKVGTND